MAIGIKANVRIRKYDSLGRIKQETKAHNLVVDAGLVWLAEKPHVGDNYNASVCAYGSSDTAVQASDTALGSEYDSGDGVYAAGATGVCTITKKFVITATETAKEAGLFTGEPTLFARATFTTVNLSDGDVLEVEWTITYTDGG